MKSIIPVPMLFKAFPGSIIAPDHCCVGNIGSMLRAMYQSLGSRSLQKVLSTLFHNALSRNGMTHDNAEYNVDGNKLNATSFAIKSSIFQWPF